MHKNSDGEREKKGQKMLINRNFISLFYKIVLRAIFVIICSYIMNLLKNKLFQLCFILIFVYVLIVLML